MIAEQPLQRFLDELASAAPTPGGGSAAAVMGAMAAALVSMVCRLTIGRKGYEAVLPQMERILQEAEALRQRLTAMIAQDVQAFNTLMAAYKLPRTSDEERLARTDAIQQALKQATDVPLACAEACVQVIDLALQAAPIGNRGVISDAGVASEAARAALRSAALNVHINAPSIEDAVFVASRRERLERALASCAHASEKAYETVLARLH
ncbi:MAG: cyclodeaminase/cyclohydrolase family protein [Burkholderiaceae bacterium]|nr:cyclodeaminase/cyclohydrolase family protein [Burkholderiaceae bacterium]